MKLVQNKTTKSQFNLAMKCSWIVVLLVAVTANNGTADDRWSSNVRYNTYDRVETGR